MRPPEVDVDYGEPLGFCAETAPGSSVWSREYTKYSVSLDCASFTATLAPKEARDEPPARAPACATASDCNSHAAGPLATLTPAVNNTATAKRERRA